MERSRRLSKVANIHKTSTKSFFSLTSRWCKMNMDMKFPPRPKSETEGISQPSTMYLKLISELVHTAYFQFPDCCIGRCHRLRRGGFRRESQTGGTLKHARPFESLFKARLWPGREKGADAAPCLSNCISINATTETHKKGLLTGNSNPTAG